MPILINFSSPSFTSISNTFIVTSGMSDAFHGALLSFWPILLCVYAERSRLILAQLSKDFNVKTLESSRVYHGELVRNLNGFIELFAILIFLPLANTMIHFITELHYVVRSQTLIGNFGSAIFIMHDLVLVLVLIAGGERLYQMVISNQNARKP